MDSFMEDKSSRNTNLCQALQELKDAKLQRVEIEEKKAMRKLFTNGGHERGLLVSTIDTFCNLKHKNITDQERDFVMNQAFIDIYNNIESLRDVNAGVAWCLTIFKNKYFDYLDSENADKRGGKVKKVLLDADTDNDVSKDKQDYDVISNSLLKLSDVQKDIVDCMQENFKLFAKKEPNRALAIALKHQDVYNPRASYLKEAIKKFIVPVRTISSSQNMKLSSDEISILLDKTNAANVDVYISESKKKLQPYIKKCRDLIL